ncbi:MAG TPA: NUDIX domain-containing protein [Sphingobacteriaceae bacterium]|nr:NUDIX domain-containing protein [Sphingobacteriaceae bacterium]
MSKASAGLLLYRFKTKSLEVLLVHPGGPYWMNKDDGAWSIPKGEFSFDEDPLEAAKREFEEETSFQIDGNFRKLEAIKQKGGKTVFAWAVEGNLDVSQAVSNLFTIEWPPNSGKQQTFPEVDKVRWFSISAARAKINTNQIALLDELKLILIQ